MKKLVLLSLLLALAAAPAMAGMAVTMRSSIYRPSGYAGGPFVADIDENDSGWAAYSVEGDFQTFCIEWNSNMQLNKVYSATIDDVVMYKGSMTALRETTKKLYASYLNEVAAGIMTKTRGQAYQEEIWASEQGDYDLSYTGALLTDNSNVTGYNSVKVMNLWDPARVDYHKDGDIQSQLIMVPTPGALILGSLGMGVVGYLRRRRSL